jgi:hypothetical protein
LSQRKNNHIPLHYVVERVSGGAMRLIQPGAGYRHLGGFKDCIPAGFLLVKPESHALAVGRPRRVGDMVGKVT